jgi:hypothetical protein
MSDTSGSSWWCPRCTHANADGDFCGQCGAHRPPDPRAGPIMANQRALEGPIVRRSSWNRPAPAIIVLVVAIVVVFLAVGLVAMRRGADEPGNEQARAGDPGTTVAPDAFARPTDPSKVIDRVSALAVVNSLWPARVQALNANDRTTLTAIESDTAREVDIAGCRCEPAPLPDDPYKAYPVGVRNNGYPASFLAQITHLNVRHEQVSDIVVFQRRSADVAWTIVFDVSIGGWHIYVPPNIDSAFDLFIPSLDGFKPDTLPDGLASYWQSWKDDGHEPADSPFDTNGFLRSRGTSIHDIDRLIASEGGRQEITYSTDPRADGVFVFPANRQGVITCGSVRFVRTGTPSEPDGTVLQSPTHDEWGPFVAPGEYQRITLSGVHMSCFVVTSKSAPIEVLGRSGGDTSVSTEPA